jgi:subtilase family serine protease
MRRRRPVEAASGLATLACLMLAGSGAMPPPVARPAIAGVLIQPGIVHLRGALAGPPTDAYCQRNYSIGCYSARQIEQAFDVVPLLRAGVTGKGETIVIVDSYGSPTVRRDLAAFDQAEGLPAPPHMSIIEPAGRVAAYKANANREGWAGETDLDVEYAHAIAPGAGIVLVETPTAENEGRTGFPAIVQAEKYVVDHHLGSVISQSFSASERSFARPHDLLSLRGAYTAAAASGVTVLAASGDSGAADVHYNGTTYFSTPVTSWPDSDPLVTGVGGVQLHLNAAGADIATPTVWNDTYSKPTQEYINGSSQPSPLASGGGRSVIFARPPYQNVVAGVVHGRRGVPDISMSGACNGGVDMYQSFPGQPAGWYPTCGTSEATPEFAGIVALADQVAGHSLGLINPYLYTMSEFRARGIVDVVSGSNTVSFRQGGAWHTVTGFRATRGYDLASGVGTVDAQYFVPELACLAAHRLESTSEARQQCLSGAVAPAYAPTPGPVPAAVPAPPECVLGGCRIGMPLGIATRR